MDNSELDRGCFVDLGPKIRDGVGEVSLAVEERLALEADLRRHRARSTASGWGHRGPLTAGTKRVVVAVVDQLVLQLETRIRCQDDQCRRRVVRVVEVAVDIDRYGMVPVVSGSAAAGAAAGPAIATGVRHGERDGDGRAGRAGGA